MIETEIKELTAAVKELTSTLSALGISQALPSAKADDKPKTPKKEAKTPPPKAEEPEVEDDILTFDEIASRFKVLVAKGGREPAIEILKDFEIKGKLTADQLPADKYREFLDAIDAVDLEALV